MTSIFDFCNALTSLETKKNDILKEMNYLQNVLAINSKNILKLKSSNFSIDLTSFEDLSIVMKNINDESVRKSFSKVLSHYHLTISDLLYQDRICLNLDHNKRIRKASISRFISIINSGMCISLFSMGKQIVVMKTNDQKVGVFEVSESGSLTLLKDFFSVKDAFQYVI